jgi:hypothetical protein
MSEHEQLGDLNKEAIAALGKAENDVKTGAELIHRFSQELEDLQRLQSQLTETHNYALAEMATWRSSAESSSPASVKRLLEAVGDVKLLLSSRFSNLEEQLDILRRLHGHLQEAGADEARSFGTSIQALLAVSEQLADR